MHEHVQAPTGLFLMYGRVFTPANIASKRSQQRVTAAVHQINMIVHLASHFGPNLTLSEAKRGLIVMVACQECTQTQGIALKAPKTKAEIVHCPHKTCGGAGHPPQAQSISHAFIHSGQEEMKKQAV